MPIYFVETMYLRTLLHLVCGFAAEYFVEALSLLYLLYGEAHKVYRELPNYLP
jgi:hypothetical protein